MIEQPEVAVGELVALINQSFDYTFGNVTVTGELANLRVSKNRWVYFDLKDDDATIKFFGTVYQLPGPLEDGMLLKVDATPRLHNLYGFSMNVRSIRPAGEGSIRKAAELLQAKLLAEGLFDAERKRSLPYPPRRIGLITSKQSAAYADFIKILDARWTGLAVQVADVQVQGEPAPAQIVTAIERFNAQAEPPDVLILIRGGGSAEDLAAFSTEQVTRAVAASRVPTLVAIGHEVDVSLAELAADVRASTPSNAAELLVPDKQDALRELLAVRVELARLLARQVTDRQALVVRSAAAMRDAMQQRLTITRQQLTLQRQLLTAYDPQTALQRGYAIVRSGNGLVTKAADTTVGQQLHVQVQDGQIVTTVTERLLT